MVGGGGGGVSITTGAGSSNTFTTIDGGGDGRKPTNPMMRNTRQIELVQAWFR